MEGNFDFIIAGAGSAGCVLANQLSANPDNRVLLIENGPDDHSASFIIRMPKGFGRILAETRLAYHFLTTFCKSAGGVPDVWLRGKTLGGSSSVNGMVWIRGQPQDYDRLAELGNKGWSWAELAPCFKQLENHALGEDELRGVGGPIEVRTHPGRSRLSEAMIAAGVAMGLTDNEDQNRLDQEGVGYLQTNIDSRGRRVSAARGFLDPIRGKRPNLHIVTETEVDRIVFRGKQAMGVACWRGGAAVEYGLSDRGEVVVSAGAIQSPKILQLSGVGPGDHLRELGIETVCDSPGVGQNMREHWLLMMNYMLRDRADSYNHQFAGRNLARNVLNYLLFGRGLMAYASNELAAFVKVLPDAVRPDAQLMYAPYSLDFEQPGAFESHPGMQFFAYPLRSTSQGNVMIRSGNPREQIEVNPEHLATEYDRQVSIHMVRYVRRYMQQAPLQPLVIEEIPLTRKLQTDDEILDAVRRHGQVGMHACGTCKMGQDEMAVVDERLRVRGVSGVRVVDCSIFPEMISGNTNAPAMAMALRASRMIAEDHA